MNARIGVHGKLTCSLAMLLAGAALLQAQPYYLNNLWNNPGSGKWENPANWTAGTAPGINDDDQIYLGIEVIIDATTSGSFASNMTVGYVTVAAPTVTLELVDSGTNVPLHILQDLDVTAGGTLVANAALQVDGATTVGSAPTNQGSLELDSGWAQFGNFKLGVLGDGDFSMYGGSLKFLGTLTLGASNSSSGTFQMSGGTLSHTNGIIAVGSQGSGAFSVYGGSVEALGFRIGNASNSIGNLYVGGGTVRASSSILVGNSLVANPCNVTISSNSSDGSIGILSVTNASGTGYMDVRHNGSVTLNGGILQLDNLILTNGGTFSNLSGTFELGPIFKVDNGGTVVLADSTNNFDSGITLGNSFGGTGNLVVQSNTLVTINSNLTVVSGSLISTSTVTLNGGSVFVTNGLTQIGPVGNGRLTISGGSHVFRQIRLGSTNGLGSGGLLLQGGHLKILGVGTGPGQGLVSNWIIWPSGDLDGSQTSLTIALTGDSEVEVSPNNPESGQGPPTGELDSMYVGAGAGYTGIYTQWAFGSEIVVSNKLIVGDCVINAIGEVILNSGTLYVTNPMHTAYLDVRNGTFTVGPGGKLVVDNLIVTNTCGHFVNNGGTIIQNHPPMLSPNLDADGDGLSNGFEQSLGMDPLNPSLVCAPPGIVAWWPAGGNADDIVGGNSGVLHGVTFAAGEVGQAFNFNGVNQFVQVPNFLNDVPTDEVTVEFWQKVTAVKDQSSFIAEPEQPGSVFSAHVPNADGKVYWDFGDINLGGRLVWAPTGPIIGVWEHFAFVASQSGNFMSIYTNGVLAATQTGMTPLFPVTGDLDLGGTGNPMNSFGGEIDEFSIYNRALSAAEIHSIYAAGSAGKCLMPAYIISAVMTGNNLNLTWVTQMGLNYRVQYSSNLRPGTWVDVPGDVPANGSTASKTVAVPPGDLQRFYRVEIFR